MHWSQLQGSAVMLTLRFMSARAKSSHRGRTGAGSGPR